MDGISIAETFGADHEESRAIFDLQAADRPVRLRLERIRQAQNGGQPDQRLPQRQFVNP